MSAQTLLDRLDKPRRTGADRWMAKCPAHEDSHASLSVRELADGRTLVHCFAGCSVDEVMRSVGMSVGDLFPERMVADYVPRLRQPFPANDVLRAVEAEVLIAAVAAGNLANGVDLSNKDRERLTVAAQRLYAAIEMINGR